MDRDNFSGVYSSSFHQQQAPNLIIVNMICGETKLSHKWKQSTIDDKVLEGWLIKKSSRNDHESVEPAWNEVEVKTVVC